jgi:hypothetical protein
MNRNELIRRRRQMHQRIRDVVAERRLRRMTASTPAQATDGAEQVAEATE